MRSGGASAAMLEAAVGIVRLVCGGFSGAGGEDHWVCNEVDVDHVLEFAGTFGVERFACSATQGGVGCVTGCLNLALGSFQHIFGAFDAFGEIIVLGHGYLHRSAVLFQTFNVFHEYDLPGDKSIEF